MEGKQVAAQRSAAVLFKLSGASLFTRSAGWLDSSVFGAREERYIVGARFVPKNHMYFLKQSMIVHVSN